MTIAVTGATGQLGRLVIEQLKSRVGAGALLALVRDPAKAAGLGVTARAADYDRPETLAPALAGVETLLLISSSEVGQRVAQHRNVIDAARAAGVGRIVYTSLLHADVSPLSLAAEHLETEAMVKASGLAFTVLRNGWYTENYTGSLAAAVAHGALIGSAGEGRISWAARADFAEAAAVVLTTPGHEGRVYELAGDDACTLADLAAEVSRQAGKAVAYNNLPPADYAGALAGFGLPPALAQAIASWDVDASNGALFDDGRVLSRLIGRPTTPLSQVVAAALA
ncbi:SDR family oxidoreductase [Methylibium rhizosphaerae]|uniref:SDR family oxidoreductase n=1 Tax=Methylibium rhizosphaerae TaxID=2570323 RepID=UPI00112D9922|nr:SDR family oxidoreductase [Methylibium rhizosphaerae]